MAEDRCQHGAGCQDATGPTQWNDKETNRREEFPDALSPAPPRLSTHPSENVNRFGRGGEFEKEGLDHDPSRDQLACPADDPLTGRKSVCRLGALRRGSESNARWGIGFKVFDLRQRSV